MSNLLERIINKGKFYFSKSYFKIFTPKVVCNICGWGDFEFQSDNWHPNTICPQCWCQVRHRLIWAILSNHKKFNKENLIKNKSVLHFAPEKIFRALIADLSSNYKTGDFFTEGYSYPGIDYNIDITDMKQLGNETFDCVIALDVLEHVSDDRKALKEIHRVLSGRGVAILTVPMKDNLKTTYEDPSITDPKEREKTFGQFDHVRVYGEDFFDRIASQGFDVTIIDHTMFDDATIKRYVLFPPILSAHPLATNYRKIYFATKK